MNVRNLPPCSTARQVIHLATAVNGTLPSSDTDVWHTVIGMTEVHSSTERRFCLSGYRLVRLAVLGFLVGSFFRSTGSTPSTIIEECSS